MLRKCLKYDLKSGLFLWSLLSVAMILLAAPAGLSIGHLSSETEGIMNAVAGLCILVYYILTVAYLISGIGLGVYRFYQNFRTDEAYLTFTLPVKRKTLLQSKLLATVITFLATLAVAFVALVIMLAFIPDENGTVLIAVYYGLGVWLGETLASQGFWSVVYFAQVIIIAFEILTALILFCFSIASRANSNKNKTKSTVGKNIAIVFLLYMGIGLLAVPILLLVFSILIYTEATELLGSVSAAEQSVITFLALIILTMAAVIANVILYKDNLSRIKNKLNLT